MPDRYGESPDDSGDPRRAIRAAEVANCRLCDTDGYRGSNVCDHIDHSTAAKRGMAMIRETMGWETL